MSSLTELESFLIGLEPNPSSVSFKGVAFEKTFNKTLGFTSDGSDFHVGIPYKQPWPNTFKDAPTTFMSPLGAAFVDTFTKGLQSPPTSGNVFIDINTLHTDISGFFNENIGSKSLIQQLADLVNQLSNNLTPIIRFLVGDPPGSMTADQRWQGNNTTKGYRADFESIFFQPSGLFKHPNAKLFVAFYAPNLDPSKDTQAIQGATSGIDSLIGVVKTMADAIHTSTGIGLGATPDLETQYQKAIAQLTTADVIKNLGNAVLPTMSWNHSKVLAVNGTTLMTGGANYSGDIYGNDKRMICDTQCKIMGDAAITAHRFCDYLWKYIEKNHLTDTMSFCFTTKLAGAASWMKPTTVDFFENTMKPTITDGKPVLTVARIGDWVPSSQLEFPVQIIDALRDIIHNFLFRFLWAKTAAFGKLGTLGAGVFQIWVLDPTSDTKLRDAYQKANISPTAWATRIAKCQAISKATQSVYIDAQVLAGFYQMKIDQYNKQVEKLNSDSTLTGKDGWDGVLWQYDLICALAKFLDGLPDPLPTGQETGLFIMLTSTIPHNEYEDVVPAIELKKRIYYFIPKFWTASDYDGFSTWFDKRCTIKRISNTPDGPWNHCKVVCCDRKLMYVGSDNHYASYNEEHGVWIDDGPTINQWHDKWWSPRWTQGAPANMTESGNKPNTSTKFDLTMGS